MEGNFVNELGLVVLDLVELFCCHFRVNIALISEFYCADLTWLDKSFFTVSLGKRRRKQYFDE
jgi:hypothetical protein